MGESGGTQELRYAVWLGGERIAARIVSRPCEEDLGRTIVL